MKNLTLKLVISGLMVLTPTLASACGDWKECLIQEISDKNMDTFDVTHAQWQGGFSYDTGFESPYSSFNVYENAGGQLLAFAQGMARYAEEMEDAILAQEWYNAWTNAVILNNDLTDNKAYASIAYTTFYYQATGEAGVWVENGDIIAGSDWDNNGKIDILEDFDGLSYGNADITAE